MKFIVEFRLKPGKRNQAVDLFEQRGPNRISGVSFRSAWIGAHADIAFVLVESADETTVRAAANSWGAIGDADITQVIDVEQF
jgi:hypothetical protein